MSAPRVQRLKEERKAKIDQETQTFFSRYNFQSSPPTADQIIADANQRKSRIDRYTYARIIARAKSLPAPAPKPIRPPAASASNYFASFAPSTAAASSAGPDPSTWIVIAVLVAWAILRR